MEDDWTYTETGPKQQLQHSKKLGHQKKIEEEEDQKPPGREQLKRKGQKQDGNRGRKRRPLQLIEISGGPL